MTTKTFFAFLFLLVFNCVRSQDYTYMHYDIREGLAGSTVYCMLQDKQGYLWFGTETGVSRFDGVHFKNFTTFDGLPDNQVLNMFEDSKGRIWMSPFNKSICYYYKGKIYNQYNDSLLRKLKLSEYVVTVAEDNRGNILLQQSSRFHVIRPSGKVSETSSYNLSSKPNYISARANKNGYFELLDSGRLLEVRTDTVIYKEKLQVPYGNYRYVGMGTSIIAWRDAEKSFMVRKGGTDRRILFDFNVAYKISILNDSMLSVNTPRGAFVFSLNNGQYFSLLPKEAVSTVFQDDEGNIWLCSLGHGVFRMNSANITNYALRHEYGILLGGYCITKFRDGWLVGSDMVRLFHVTRHGVKKVYGFKDSLPERITTINIDADSNVVVGTDGRVLGLGRDFNLKGRFIERFNSNDIHLNGKVLYMSVKDTYAKGNMLYMANGRNAMSVDIKTYKPIDTFWRERSTSIFVSRDTIYLGTLDGLFRIAGKQPPDNVGLRMPELRNRIMDIQQADDSTLWIATFSGLHAFRDGRIISSLTEANGLISNFCRVLDIYHDELWVGTDKGLQKINIHDPLHPRPGYSLASELSSTIINAVEADSTTVIVATPEGVNIIDKFNISLNSFTKLYMDAVTVSGKPMAWSNQPLYLSNRNNNIRFEFSGISYRSAGDMKYKFRLLGLDSTWRTTTDNFLNYPTLPGGQYELQLVAINKFGIESAPVTVDFIIEKKLIQKWWFQLLLVSFVASVVWISVSWRIRTIRRKAEEKNSMNKKIAELEQLAMKSQMNPHFVFNSLNSIQHYVLDKDIEGANKFISGFARLIRQTLDISARPDISLEEEIRYLSTYLQLEQVKLENKFTYEVLADKNIRPDECHIPPMVLQPFVENCIRHGIRFRNDNEGKVTVHFRQANGYLECSIEDNGVGRKVAALHKSRTPIEYQSKGISLTTDRINLLNRNHPRPILLNIYDLEDKGGQSEGTRVIISFPI